MKERFENQNPEIEKAKEKLGIIERKAREKAMAVTVYDRVSADGLEHDFLLGKIEEALNPVREKIEGNDLEGFETAMTEAIARLKKANLLDPQDDFSELGLKRLQKEIAEASDPEKAREEMAKLGKVLEFVDGENKKLEDKEVKTSSKIIDLDDFRKDK